MFSTLTQSAHDIKTKRLRANYIRREAFQRRLSKLFGAFKDNVLYRTSMRHILRLRIPLFKKLILLGPFIRWKRRLLEGRLVQTADWFRQSIWPRQVIKQCFSALKLEHTRALIDRTRVETIRQRRNLVMKARFLKFMTHSLKARMTRYGKADKLWQAKRVKFIRMVFYALQRQCIALKANSTLHAQAELLHYGNTLRKALLGLQRNQCQA
jgi:hypothetical protein